MAECEVSLVTDCTMEPGGAAAGEAADEERMLGGVGFGLIAPEESNGVVIETMRTLDSSQREAREGRREREGEGERGGETGK